MWILVPFCFLWFVNGCFGAKVVMMPLFGPSHYLVLAKLAEELDRRGHEVIIFVHEGADYASEAKPFVKVFKSNITHEKKKHEETLTKDFAIISHVLRLFELKKNYCNSFLSDEKVLNELKTAQILVGEILYPCSALVAAKFHIPHVVVAMSSLGTPMMEYYGVSTYPSYAPQPLSGLTPNMGLRDRVKNFGFYIFTRFILWEMGARGIYSVIKAKHNIKPEESVYKTLGTVDLVLLEKDLLLDYATPVPPYVKEVGSFMPGPAKPLQPEWETFMSSSGDDGVILVSFGSNVDTLDDRIVATMNEAFSKLPQKVIWRINTDKFEGKIASNIKTVRWLPQNDILGHPKTKLFIGHGGANGLAEAVYHGVPMIFSPFFGDQLDNANFVEYVGLGRTLSVKTTTVDKLVDMINKVLKEKRYKEKAVNMSRIMKMRPRTPVEEASDLVEYVISVGHLDHLKPKGLELPFYQLYMLDVLLVLGIVIALVLFIIVAVVKRILNFCCGSSRKIKTS